MKQLLVLGVFLQTLSFCDMEMKNYLGYEFQSYLKTVDKNKKNDQAVTFQSELKYSLDDGKIYAKVDALKEKDDLNRDFFNITELYYSHGFSDFDLDFGKKVIFLGSLEANNIVNIFNRQNYQKDSFSTHKNGSHMLGFNYYYEDESTLALYLKGFEEDIKFPNSNSPYFAFGNAKYNEELQYANGDEEFSFLANYSKSFDDEFIADTAFGIFYGYDNNILFTNQNSVFKPYLFQSAKLFTYDTIIMDSTLYKVEASYTKVVEDGEITIDDFYELGFGAEHTIEQFYKNHNLGLIAEYYQSDREELSFDNDMFLALRYSLNDKDASEFLAGLIQDMKKAEHSAFVKYAGRLTDTLNISSDLRYIKSDGYLDEHLRFGCEVKYYF